MTNTILAWFKPKRKPKPRHYEFVKAYMNVVDYENDYFIEYAYTMLENTEYHIHDNKDDKYLHNIIKEMQILQIKSNVYTFTLFTEDIWVIRIFAFVYVGYGHTYVCEYETHHDVIKPILKLLL